MKVKFCLTLPSDASHDLYPEKSQVRLPRPVELLELLQSSWVVGLCRLAHPKPAYGVDLQNITVYCDVMRPVGGEHARALNSHEGTTSSKTCITCLWTKRTLIPSP